MPAAARKPRGRQLGLALQTDLSGANLQLFLQKLAKKPKGGVEGLDDLTREQLLGVCAALNSEVYAALTAAVVDPNASLGEDQQPVNSLEDIVLTLHGAAVLALELATCSKQDPPDLLLSVATTLHDEVLLSHVDPALGSMQVDMQDAVMRLCCFWWTNRLPGNEALVARSIPYSLMRVIDSLDRNKTALVNACYTIRDALELLDYEDESIKDTKRLLLVASMHPAFLRDPVGRRFIAGLFKLEPQMTRELAAIVRNQITAGQRSTLIAYGEILFRAWRDTVGPCAAEIESELEKLIEAALMASTPALAAAIRIVLDGLHSHKNVEKRLNPVLVRLYDPVLSRAFSAANAEVRRNAVNLLARAFPIVDPDAGPDESNTRVLQQLGFLMESLMDPCPAVREAAVAACCQCLKYYWEILPAASSAKIITDMTSKLAFDKSSRGVRVAVLNGLCTLMDSQHAQLPLKKALPTISDMLYDNDPVVREALMDMLVAVSRSRGLQLWDVMPPAELLDIMALDEASPTVSRKILRILVPKFFTDAKEGSALLSALLRSKPEAGMVFCRNLVASFSSTQLPQPDTDSSTEFTASVPVEQILQLTGDLAAHLLSTAGSVAAPPPQAAPAKAGGRGRKQKATTGKKRGRRAQAEPVDEEVAETEHQAAEGGDQQGRGDDEDNILRNAQSETEEGWLAILEGLVIVAHGLGVTVEANGECGAEDLEGVLPEDTLLGLLLVAEEQVRKPKALELVLRLMGSVHFTSGAKQIRKMLFERLAQGILPGVGGDGQLMELDGHHGPPGHDVGHLFEMLKALAMSDNAPKLMAILSAALGVREPQPIRKPVCAKQSGSSKGAKRKQGAAAGRDELEQLLQGVEHDGHQESDETICLGCRRTEPSDTMLLCDGCDAGCHLHCMRPALSEIPEAEWFCSVCESQLQSVTLTPAATGRCICLLLQHDKGRELLCEHPDFDSMIKAMHNLAGADADDILRIAQAGGGDEADSAPAPLDITTAYDRYPLLGDPWGGLSRSCRAALHRAMRAALPRQPAAVAQSEAQPGQVHGGPTRRGQRAHASEEDVPAAEAQRDQDPEAQPECEGAESALLAFADLVPIIEHALQTCEQLAEMILAEQCAAAHMATLQYSRGLVLLLHVVHQTEFMNMSGQYIAKIAGFCGSQIAMAQAAADALVIGEVVSQQQQAFVSSTIHVLLGLTQQLVEAVSRQVMPAGSQGGVTPAPALPRVCRSGGSSDGSESNHLLGQKLETRMNGAADEGVEGGRPVAGDAEEELRPLSQLEGEEPEELQEDEEDGLQSAGEEVDRLAVAVVSMLCDPAVAALLNSGRAEITGLLSVLLDAMHKGFCCGWLKALCKLTGEALTAESDLMAQVEDILSAADGTSLDADAAQHNNNGAEGAVEGAGDGAADTDGNKDCQQRGGRKKGGASKGAKTASGPRQARANKLHELLLRESPAVGAMASLLLRACMVRKMHGHVMLALVRITSMALAAGEAPAACEVSSQQEVQADAPGVGGPGAFGALVLLSLCQAASRSTAPGATRQKAAGQRGVRPQAAAAHESCAEAESATESLTVLWQSLGEEGRGLGLAGQAGDGAVALQRVQSLVQSLMQGLLE